MAFAVVGLLGIVLILFSKRPMQGSRMEAGQGSERGVASVLEGLDVGSEHRDTEAPIPSARPPLSHRQPEGEPAAIQGWVFDEDGGPLAGVHLSLVALSAKDREWEPSWRANEWGDLGSPTAKTKTGEDGAFRFASWVGAEESGEFVLSASLLDFETALEHRTYPLADDEGIRLVLHRAPPVQVLVLGEDGAPAAGATVDQYGIATGKQARLRDGGEQAWKRTAHRRATTGTDGVASVPRLPGDEVLVASLGPRRSIPWQGSPGDRVTLRLLPGFRLGGVVSLPDWSSLGYEGERRIRVTAETGGLERSLATLRGVEAGTWGPLDLPVIPNARYWVHLEGSPIIPLHESFRTPAAGATLTVNLDASLGTPLWVVVTDMEDNVLADSEVTLKWELNGVPNRLTRHSQEDGFTNLWSLPPVPFSIVAGAPGYATQEFPGKEIPENDDYLQVRLLPAGKLTGHCFFRDEPVHDFTVMTYVSGPPRWTKAQFTGREDGAFELDDVPLGEVFVIASNDTLPPSDPVAVTIPDGGSGDVRVDLRDGWARQGRLVDGETGEPIVGARIRRRAVGELLAEEWWGPDVTTNPGGSFELDALPRGVTVFQVSAPGYATMDTRVTGGPKASESPLYLELERPVPLRLQLVGLPSGSYGGFDVSGSGPAGELSTKWFDPDGFVEYDSISPGFYRVRVRGGLGVRDGVTVSVDVTVSPRRASDTRVRAGGENHLSVQLDLESVPEPRSDLWAQMRYRASTGEDLLLVGPFDEEGLFEVDGIDAKSVWVELIRLSGEKLSATHGVFTSKNLSLQISADTEPFHLRVVDGHGTGLPGIYVMVVDPETGSFGASGSTGSGGVINLMGVPPKDMLLNLYSASHGAEAGIAIDGREHEAEVLLEGGSSIRIRAQRNGQPITGAVGGILAAGNEVYYSRRTSDSDGQLSWENLSPGSYRVHISHPAYWAEERDFSASEDPKEVAVELRKLGSVMVRLVSLEGAALSGEQVHLTDLATKEEVGGWLAKGLVTSSGPATDARGEATFGRIPEGDYGVLGSGGVVLGTVTVTGEGTDLEVLRLDRE